MASVTSTCASGSSSMKRDGMVADLVIFDEAKVTDPSTFESPHQYAAGFSYVVVNGALVLEDGALTKARPGVALRGAGAAR